MEVRQMVSHNTHVHVSHRMSLSYYQVLIHLLINIITIKQQEEREFRFRFSIGRYPKQNPSL